MVSLSRYEQQLGEGREGRLKQICIENIIRYAEIVGATELCEVTKATVFCGAHNYLNVVDSDDPAKVFSLVNLGVEETVPFDTTYENCYIQSCVAPCDQWSPEPFGQDAELFDRNRQFIDMAKEAGVTVAGTCSPYLTGWIPVRGEHFVKTESGMTVLGNSLWGAMANADGIEAAFWSAICGRTPKYRNHIEENRGATHTVTVAASIQDLIEWDLLGSAIGQQLPTGSVPVVDGAFTGVTFEKLRQLFTTVAITSNCEICHVAGYTPEARSVEDALREKRPRGEISVDSSHLSEVYSNICSPGSGEVDFVSLGCPHFDINQIKRVAGYLSGEKISSHVHFMVWTVYPIKKMADENGYTRTIEDAGGHIYTSSCPGTIGSLFLNRYSGFVFDSLKQAGSVRSMVPGPVYYGDVYSCINAAIRGSWKEEDRWESTNR